MCNICVIQIVDVSPAKFALFGLNGILIVVRFILSLEKVNKSYQAEQTSGA
jgi:hypothetical protein